MVICRSVILLILPICTSIIRTQLTDSYENRILIKCCMVEKIDKLRCLWIIVDI